RTGGIRRLARPGRFIGAAGRGFRGPPPIGSNASMERERHADGVRALFDDWARTGRSDTMAASHGPSARPAFDRLPLRADSWFLAVGCGTGSAVRWAAERAPQGKAVGIDLSSAMVEHARALSAGFANVEFHRSEF